jgi:hypothetical protein
MQVIMFEIFTWANVSFYESILVGKSSNLYPTKVCYIPISKVSIYAHKQVHNVKKLSCRAAQILRKPHLK